MYQTNLFENPRGRYTRWYTFENPEGKKGAGAMTNYGHKGDPCRVLQPGETFVLAACEGAGMIQQIWMTYDKYNDPARIRTLRLEMFWDGEETPAVSAPVDDFFCQAAWAYKKPFENALFSSPEGRSCNCFVPMPFKKGAKVTLTNESKDLPATIFYCIEVGFGMELPEDCLYFHCIYQPERKTVLGEDFEILPRVSGAGRYLGTNVLMRDGEGNHNTWFGEGEVKIYLDGDLEYPTLAGTGTEDYILSAWGQGEFSNMYAGCTMFQNDLEGRLVTQFYRLHIPNPVYFSEDCRVTLQQMGGGETSRIHQVRSRGANIKVVRGDSFAGVTYLEDEVNPDDPNMSFCCFLREDYLSCVTYLYLDRPVL